MSYRTTRTGTVTYPVQYHGTKKHHYTASVKETTFDDGDTMYSYRPSHAMPANAGNPSGEYTLPKELESLVIWDNQ